LASFFKIDVPTQIDINASPARVWNVLTDFASYPEWNPFIVRIKGEPKEGTRLDVTFKLNEAAADVKFRTTVKVVEPERKFIWLGRLGIPKIMDGEHGFLIENGDGGKVVLIHYETFSGLLVPFIGKVLEKMITKLFDQINKALKKRAESSE